MVSKIIKIGNQTGLHARPASELVHLCKKHQSHIQLKAENKLTDACSIIGLLGLGAKAGIPIEVFAEGKDEEKALEAVCHFLETVQD